MKQSRTAQGTSKTAWLITIGGFGVAAAAAVGILAAGAGGLFATTGRPGGPEVAASSSLTPSPSSPASPHADVGDVGHGFWVRVDSLEHRLEENPGDASALLRLARLLHDAHRLADAAPYYERLLKLDSPDRRVWFDLASVHAARGEWERAASVMERFLSRQPGDPAALYNLGAIEANRGRIDDAVAHWKRVEAEAPGTEFATRAADALDRVTREE